MIQKCKKCNKVLGAGNKSGLCSHHYRIDWHNKRNKKMKEALRNINELEELTAIVIKKEALKYIKAKVPLKIFLGITKEDTK